MTSVHRSPSALAVASLLAAAALLPGAAPAAEPGEALANVDLRDGSDRPARVCK